MAPQNAGPPTIPSISTVAHGAFTPSLVQDGNVVTSQQTPSSTGLLSPRGAPYTGRSSEDETTSPVPSDMPDSTATPPSPALSSHSVHLKTSLALRGNRPDEKSGMAPLGLLPLANASSPGGSSSRRPSNATSITEMGSDDAHSDSDPWRVHSTAASAAYVDAISAPYSSKAHDSDAESGYKKSKKKKKKRKGKKKRRRGEAAEDGGKAAHELELEQGAAIDSAPFSFTPYELAHTLDPKNLGALASVGGVVGLLGGLGTNAERGLPTSAVGSSESHHRESTEKAKAAPSGAPADTAKTQYAEKDKVPEVIPTAPSGDTSSPPPPEDPQITNASIADRKRVCGKNVLPARPSKTLLQLMWMASQDKVLVCSDFSTFRPSLSLPPIV